FGDGEHDDAEIQQKRPVIHVPDIQLEPLVPLNIVATADLRETGDSRLDVVATHLLGGVEIEIFHQQRSWSNEGHVALEHVPELGKLVQTGLAQEFAKPTHALSIV